MQLSNHIKITKVADPTTAGTSAVNSAGVDMSGFDGVLFITSFGTAAANNTINAAQGNDNTSDWQDLEGTGVSSGTSDEDVWLDVYRPTDRYVRLEVARGTSTTLGDIWAIQYCGPRKLPAINVESGTITGKAVVSPAEGTP